MLSKEEKEELLKDGLDPKRRGAFMKGRDIRSYPLFSLDDFIQYLSSINKIFPPSAPLRKVTVTKFNHL